MELLVPIGVTVLLLLIGYVFGSARERRHLVELARREETLAWMPMTNFETLPADWTVHDSGLVVGSCVISIDYFKRFVAGLRGLFGGRIVTYEPLLDRARREAMLRLRESARERGFDAVVNLRLQTARLANDDGASQNPIAGVEVLATGTALRRS